MNWSEICKVELPEGKSGSWSVRRFTVDMKSIEALRCALHGRPVSPGTYTRLYRKGDWNPVMSDTPAEVRDHLEPLMQAKRRGGKVLINGLGLGVIVRGLLSLPNITDIYVVEKEQDVTNLIAPSYRNPKVHIILADAFTMQWIKGTRFQVVWHDIWPSICADNLDDMLQLHRKYERMTDWQDSWCREECRRGR